MIRFFFWSIFQFWLCLRHLLVFVLFIHFYCLLFGTEYDVWAGIMLRLNLFALFLTTSSILKSFVSLNQAEKLCSYDFENPELWFFASSRRDIGV
ncbi:hypothetical protein BDZ91DRAFT_714386 [Kalaharituber pfeilii]|nr:hypothetical protein BDZ91DRAFT_714386 [Kalaharituber pfeilii]